MTPLNTDTKTFQLEKAEAAEEGWIKSTPAPSIERN